jgi:hypothetical protein
MGRLCPITYTLGGGITDIKMAGQCSLRRAWLKTYASGVTHPLSGLAVFGSTQNQMKGRACLLGVAEILYAPLLFEMFAVKCAALVEEAFIATYE